ncbi:odorant receptor 94b-like [Diabrotica virgifera virgifera]|uniref:Odorant receptor n=1 Tax=Diabrotica virgifera virgifera TaxID=50390 RepID=A0ABM5K184_DIAVI|nr:odorant receptor 94b-like [Diabrotica virgifera virgifera]
MVMKTNDYCKLFIWSIKLYLMAAFIWPTLSIAVKTISLIIQVSVSAFLFVGLSLYLYDHITDFDKATNVMCMLMLVFMGVYKIGILWYNSNEFKSLFHTILTEFWPYDLINLESKRKIKNMYRLMNGLVWLFFAAGFSYDSIFLIPSLFSTRGLPYVIAYPFNWTVSPWYEIIYCTQTFVHGITITIITTGANFLVLGTLLNISSQYCILQECFEIFNTPEMYATNKKLRNIMNDGLENKYTDERKEYFVRCVRHHQIILRITNQFNNAMNPLEIYQLAASIFALCVGALRFANMDSLGNLAEQAVSFLYLVGFSMQLFIDCFFGTYLNHQASLLPEAIFHSNWKTLDDEELRKDFVFLLQNSQRIPQFNAYKVYDMHMMSFIKVIKVAFSFYTMLSKLK